MKTRLVNKFIVEDYGKQLLEERGITDVEKFLRPVCTVMQSYNDLENIDKGQALIDELASDAYVGLLVDCDVDGYTSAAIIYGFLKELKPDLKIKYYLHTGKQHGLEEHYEEMLQENFELIIIPDASSNDSQYAEMFSCPILVIDHHQVEDPITAKNMVVINNQLSPKYKNKFLSGASMVYRFCESIYPRIAAHYLDLAALGSIGDVMSSKEIENQWIWKIGLGSIKNYFFQVLLKKQSYSICGQQTDNIGDITHALTPMNVAFYIVPMINALIRVGTQEEKERLFLAFIDGHRMVPCNKRGAKGTMEEVAVESARECTNARTHQNKDKAAMVEQLEQKIFKYDLLENKILFIELDEDDDFPPELNGLAAMELCAKYKHPTLIGRLNDEGYLRGSARGLSNTDMPPLKEYLASTGLFEYTQGHSGAFGHSIKKDNLEKMLEVTNRELAAFDLNESCYDINFERMVNSEDLSDMIYDLDRYKFLWLNDNPEPLVHIKPFTLNEMDIHIMGSRKDTLKITVNGISYIKFHANDLIDEINGMRGRKEIELVCKPNVNVYNGVTSPQMFIEAYELKESNPLEF